MRRSVHRPPQPIPSSSFEEASDITPSVCHGSAAGPPGAGPPIIRSRAAAALSLTALSADPSESPGLRGGIARCVCCSLPLEAASSLDVPGSSTSCREPLSELLEKLDDAAGEPGWLSSQDEAGASLLRGLSCIKILELVRGVELTDRRGELMPWLLALLDAALSEADEDVLRLQAESNPSAVAAEAALMRSGADTRGDELPSSLSADADELSDEVTLWQADHDTAVV